MGRENMQGFMVRPIDHDTHGNVHRIAFDVGEELAVGERNPMKVLLNEVSTETYSLKFSGHINGRFHTGHDTFSYGQTYDVAVEGVNFRFSASSVADQRGLVFFTSGNSPVRKVKEPESTGKVSRFEVDPSSEPIKGCLIVLGSVVVAGLVVSAVVYLTNQ